MRSWAWLSEISQLDPEITRVVFLHQDNPVEKRQENELAIQENDLTNHMLLVTYGLPIKNIDKIEKWLNLYDDVSCVFLENNISRLLEGLSSSKIKKILKHPQAFLYWLTSKNHKQVVKKITDKFSDLPIKKAVFFNDEQTPSFLQEFCLELEGARTLQDLMNVECVNQKKGIWENYYENIARWSPFLDAYALKDQFKGIPALICGAGPSLAGQTALLKEFEKKGMIIAGGSALKSVCSEGVVPHMTACVDPNKEQISRMDLQIDEFLPCLMIGRSQKDALIKGPNPKLFFPGIDHLSFCQKFETEWGFSQPDLENLPLNVVHVCFLQAYFMGCSPIFFIGLDLSMTQEKGYHPSWADRSLSSSHYGAYREVSDKNGRQVFTHKQWLNERDWMSQFVLLHQERDYFNLSSTGLKIEGIEEVRSLEMLGGYEEKDIRGSLKDLLQRAPSCGYHAKNRLSTLKQEMFQVIKYAKVLSDIADKVLKILPKDISRFCLPYESAQKSLESLFPYRHILQSQHRLAFLKFARKYAHYQHISSQKEKPLFAWKFLKEKMSILIEAATTQIKWLEEAGI